MKPRSTPLRRSAPPKRKARIAPSTKRIRSKGGKRFPKGYDQAYRAYVASRLCLLFGRPDHVCGPSEPAHVHADATGVGDRGQLIPLCARAHRTGTWSFHTMGRHSFPKFWGLGTFETLERLAKLFDARYAAEHPAGWGDAQ